jgi:hypothetical protein
MPLLAYRGEVRDLNRFAIENEAISCVWLCFKFSDAAAYARSKVHERRGPIGYVYTCQLALAKVVLVDSEDDVFALAPSALDAVSRLRRASDLLRSEGFDGIYNDCEGRWGPEIGVLESRCISIVNQSNV